MRKHFRPIQARSNKSQPTDPVVYLAGSLVDLWRISMNVKGFRLVVSILVFVTVFMMAGVSHAGTELMIVLDASGSMTSPGTPGTAHSKFDEVRSALTDLLQNLPSDVSVGLRIIGGSPAADCYSSFIYTRPLQGNRSQIQDYIESIRPAGMRGLYQGIEDGLGDLGRSDYGTDKIVLVITDGGDDCGRDFEVLARSVSSMSGAPRIMVYGLDLLISDRDTLGPVVSASGGRVVSLSNPSELPGSMLLFTTEFENNVRVHLYDSNGNSIRGDVVIKNTSSGEVISEKLDVTDLALNLDAGTYEVTGRYLGQEVRNTFTHTASDSRTVSLEFELYLEPFIVSLTDLYDQPLRARITFVNAMMEPILTTDVNSSHRVNLPSGAYTIQIRIGDYSYDVAGVLVGPGFDQSLAIEVPVELGVLEIEMTNLYGTPLNARISIFDQDGTLMEEAPFTSYLYTQLPPGTYRIHTEFHNQEREELITIYSGDQRQVGIEMNVSLGDLYIRLLTESGNDVWGWVKVYDSSGNLIERYDRDRIESPEWYITDIPIGTYRIEAEADGVVRIMTGVEVTDNAETPVVIHFPENVY